MKNLLNFFFSFEKMFKEKLIVPFFWLAIIYYGLKYLVQAVDGVQLDPLNWVIVPLAWFVKILLTLIIIRMVAELAIAIFRINDNLSPDKGRSELADIDPMLEARKAAELAAARAREATKHVGERAQAATKSAREGLDDMSETVQAKAKSATASVKHKTEELTHSGKARTESIMGKGSVPDANQDPTPAKILEPSAATTTAPKKRGRPTGSKKKTTPAKSTAAKKSPPKKRGRPAGSTNKSKTIKAKPKSTVAPKKRGPKPGAKIPRDADGNLLKKDGTPRAKPGRKPKS